MEHEHQTAIEVVGGHEDVAAFELHIKALHWTWITERLLRASIGPDSELAAEDPRIAAVFANLN